MPYRIAVVGFGVGGAAAALELARSGHEVSVYERSWAGHAQGAGLLLQPSGQQVLARLGLLDAVVAGAEPIDELFAETGSGRVLSRLPYRDLGENTNAYGVGRTELVEPLRRAAVEAGATVRFETTVAEVNGELGLLTLGKAPESMSESFDLVVVAEGTHARITALSLGLIGRRHEYSHAAFWAAGPCTAVR